MPDILIRGIEMPGLNGEELRILIQVDGTARIDRWTYWEPIEVFELPEHGDLIDRDATIKESKKPTIFDLTDVPDFLCEQPVIIPANKETQNAN